MKKYRELIYVIIMREPCKLRPRASYYGIVEGQRKEQLKRSSLAHSQLKGIIYNGNLAVLKYFINVNNSGQIHSGDIRPPRK